MSGCIMNYEFRDMFRNAVMGVCYDVAESFGGLTHKSLVDDTKWLYTRYSSEMMRCPNNIHNNLCSCNPFVHENKNRVMVIDRDLMYRWLYEEHHGCAVNEDYM